MQVELLRASRPKKDGPGLRQKRVKNLTKTTTEIIVKSNESLQVQIFYLLERNFDIKY